MFLGQAASLAATPNPRPSRLTVGVERMPLKLKSIGPLRSVCVTSEELLRDLAGEYAVDTALRSPQLLGSLQVLGAPTQLLSNIGRGLRDLVAMPLEVSVWWVSGATVGEIAGRPPHPIPTHIHSGSQPVASPKPLASPRPSPKPPPRTPPP